mmetsp:Transcript_50289/g.119686  ORF Transcript_50289/g.119686 Transcript_50289/m.119686 type:complete len:216 (-) Transcript_50289:494-1141(-)
MSSAPTRRASAVPKSWRRDSRMDARSGCRRITSLCFGRWRPARAGIAWYAAQGPVSGAAPARSIRSGRSTWRRSRASTVCSASRERAETTRFCKASGASATRRMVRSRTSRYPSPRSSSNRSSRCSAVPGCFRTATSAAPTGSASRSGRARLWRCGSVLWAAPRPSATQTTSTSRHAPDSRSTSGATRKSRPSTASSRTSGGMGVRRSSHATALR